MLMHGAYIRASAILDGEKRCLCFHASSTRSSPRSSCGLVPHDSPRQVLNFSLDEMIRVVDETNVEQNRQQTLFSFMSLCRSKSPKYRPRLRRWYEDACCYPSYTLVW